ncbi:hypothetical protein FQA39_LY17772 [Lamprigera yunnana]|nr:hypothetical protein FQA39_LY17772 [Lamprigera yunnana]
MELIRNRGQIKAKVNRFEVYLNTLTANDNFLSQAEVTRLSLQLINVEPILDFFSQVRDDIESISDNLENEYDETFKFEENNLKLISVAKVCLSNYNDTRSAVKSCFPVQPIKRDEKDKERPDLIPEIPDNDHPNKTIPPQQMLQTNSKKIKTANLIPPGSKSSLTIGCRKSPKEGTIHPGSHVLPIPCKEHVDNRVLNMCATEQHKGPISFFTNEFFTNFIPNFPCLVSLVPNCNPIKKTETNYRASLSEQRPGGVQDKGKPYNCPSKPLKLVTRTARVRMQAGDPADLRGVPARWKPPHPDSANAALGVVDRVGTIEQPTWD